MEDKIVGKAKELVRKRRRDRSRDRFSKRPSDWEGLRRGFAPPTPPQAGGIHHRSRHSSVAFASHVSGAWPVPREGLQHFPRGGDADVFQAPRPPQSLQFRRRHR